MWESCAQLPRRTPTPLPGSRGLRRPYSASETAPLIAPAVARTLPPVRLGSGAIVQSAVPAGLLTGVLALDAVRSRLPFNLLISGGSDELCHLATACLTLCAAASWTTLLRHRTFVLSALVASVLIDVDHVPLYAGVSHIASGGRPYTHSLATVAVSLALGLVIPRARPVLTGAAIGFCLHFLRDIATGPGLPLWWPVSAHNVRCPYTLYACVLLSLSAFASLRAGGGNWRGSAGPDATGDGRPSALSKR
jgi:inner membrane protein